ncbi:alginate export family protein [Parabacteroides sp. PF5-6]|uniref:alginate export family protein n=1 Tax=Parabacteroides sp. PF5-6 TaxID=1742403 RepID=UPI00240662AA|nr:alginate export family protein [Parabacteroides sp. PF5-6]
MKRIALLTCVLALLLGHDLTGQTPENETSLSFQIRPRAEYRNGALMPRGEGELPASFVNNRARLSLNYKRADYLIMKLSAQHVGVWGQDPQIDKNGRFILNEAWARLNLGSGFFAQLGRQGLVYDDERLLGGLDWNVAGRFHDALKLGFEDHANKLHLVLAYNQNDEKTKGGNYYLPGGQPYKTMQTLWYQHAATAYPFSVSALILNLGQEGGDGETLRGKTRYMQTLGLYLSYAPGRWNFVGSTYFQTGENAAGTDVGAWMGSLKAAYAIDRQWGVSVGTDYLSGQEAGDSKIKAFNPLYGTHHKFYGSMDYFYASSFRSGYNPGLWDLYGGLTYKASPKVNLSFNYHYFRMAADVYADGSEVAKGLGSEFDFQLDWTLMKDVRLSLGYSVMAGTASMDIVKGGSHKSWQDWGWMSLNINPQIFFAKW